LYFPRYMYTPISLVQAIQFDRNHITVHLFDTNLYCKDIDLNLSFLIVLSGFVFKSKLDTLKYDIVKYQTLDRNHSR